jgi:DNA-binding NarL/FixJ family response regulator
MNLSGIMPPLSPKQTTFLELYFQGENYKTICARLTISMSTAKTYSKQILTKTKAPSLRRAAYVRFVRPLV